MNLVTEHYVFRSFHIMTREGVVVEFQAFRGLQNEYIIKGFAAVNLATGRYFIELFDPPYERDRLPEKTQTSNE